MAVATEAEIEANGHSTGLPMGRKTARVLAEHAALGVSYLEGPDRGNEQGSGKLGPTS